MGGISMRKSISTMLTIVLTLSTMVGCGTKNENVKQPDAAKQTEIVKKEKALLHLNYCHL